MSDPVLVAVVVSMNEAEWKAHKTDEKFENNNNYHAHWGRIPSKGDKPSYIGYGYEHLDSHGFGQDGDYQSESSIPEYGTEALDDWVEQRPMFIGYAVASTWNGYIEFNAQLELAIKKWKKVLKDYFPKHTVKVIVRGKQN